MPDSQLLTVMHFMGASLGVRRDYCHVAENEAERLFFDVESGLLLRKVVLTETALCMDPEQTDFEDYRDVDGIKLPFTVRVSYLDDNHLGTTRSVKEVKHNAPIDDAMFKPPDAK